MLFLKTLEKQNYIYVTLQFSLRSWVLIHLALCTAFIFEDDAAVKIALLRFIDDIEGILKEEGVVDDEDLQPIHKIIKSKRRARKTAKWLKKRLF